MRLGLQRKKGGGLCPLDPYQGVPPWTGNIERQERGITRVVYRPVGFARLLPFNNVGVWGEQTYTFARQRGPGAEPLAFLSSATKAA